MPKASSASSMSSTESEPAQILPLLTIPKVAALLGVSRPTVYELIRHQHLPIRKLGRSVRIDQTDFKQWLEDCRQ